MTSGTFQSPASKILRDLIEKRRNVIKELKNVCTVLQIRKIVLCSCLWPWDAAASGGCVPWGLWVGWTVTKSAPPRASQPRRGASLRARCLGRLCRGVGYAAL